MFQEKQYLFKKFKSSGKQEDKEAFAICRKKFKNAVKRRKGELERELALNINSDPKSFFKYASCKKKSNSIGPFKSEMGNLVIEDKNMAVILNNFFSSVFLEEHEVIRDVIDVEGALNDLAIDKNRVLKCLKKVNPNKAPGPDNIYARVLVECSESIAEVLTDIFQLSLTTGIVPSDWKRANVVPIFKQGNRQDPGNYRPVSLTSVVGKILESIIKEGITSYIEEKKILRSVQHGFRKGKSCQTNLLDFYDRVSKELDKGNNVDIIYLDFKKAFDKVSHFKLLGKLKAISIGGNVLNWIKNWLLNREQRVMVNGHYSEWSKVGSGVPQGSILGPLFFLIFINDIGAGISSKISIFADDTKLLQIVNNEAEALALQGDLNRLAEWAVEWKMFFNVSKCKVLHLGFGNRKFSYVLNGETVGVTSSFKDLGITFSEDFKFASHCEIVSKKANQMLGFIRNSISNQSREVILPLYKSLVRPHLEYCIQVWSPYLKKDRNLIERVQKRATRLIKGMKGKNYEQRLQELNLFSLEKRRLRGDLIQTFKILRNLGTVDEEMFSIRANSITRGHSLKILKPDSRLDLRKNFFSHRVVNNWNELSEGVDLIKSIASFKNFIDKEPILASII